MSNETQLFSLALAARDNAYAPYSAFYVGAALIDNNSRFHSGCNVENVSYPCGTCAEAGAIAAMCAQGGTGITEILIVSGGNQLITPCGACLQRIKEFASPDTLIHLATLDGVQKTLRMQDLLPFAFDNKELRHD